MISALSHLLTDTLDTGVIDYLTPDNTVVTDVHQLPPLLIPVGRRSLLADSWRAAPDLPGAQQGSGVHGGARRLLVSGGVHAQEVRRAGRLGFWLWRVCARCLAGAHGQRAGVSWRCPLYCLRQGLACWDSVQATGSVTVASLHLRATVCSASPEMRRSKRRSGGSGDVDCLNQPSTGR